MLKTQVVDISRSAIITDPEAFYENLMSTGAEDSPERTMPIVAYEGYNFLPTVYGYRSYFDATAKLNIYTLSARCDKVLNFQLADYSNLLVALAEDGIYTNPGKVANAVWTKAVGVTAPPSGEYKEWTYCVIENKLYMYRQGDAYVHKLTNVPGASITNFIPSFLNMAGQMGIFRANGRLGFWDSANSISWSSVFDLQDFTPSLETLAGNSTFNDVLGRIISIKAFGSGFVIYSTKNIVGAEYSAPGSVIFSAHTLVEVAGIWSSKQVCTSITDTEHYAYTNTGIKKISTSGKVETVFTPVFDFLREARDPVYLDFLQGRYLFINVINPAYISGYVTFSQVDVLEHTVRFLLNGGEYTETLPETIGGIPLEDKIGEAINDLASDGMYAEWTASGSKLISSRIPSSMNPYQVDDPFTYADDYPYTRNTAPFYTNEELLDIRETGVWDNKFSVDNSIPFSQELGWHDTPLGTGRTDSELTRMKARQKTEWDEYATLVTSLRNALAVLPPEDIEKVWDPVLYAPGVLPASTSDTVSTEIGTIPAAPAGEPIETFTGVGTYHPAYEYKQSFTREYAITRLVTTSVIKTYGTPLELVVSDPYPEYGGALEESVVSEEWAIAYSNAATVSHSSEVLSLHRMYGEDGNRTRWNQMKALLTSVFPIASEITHYDKTFPVTSVTVENDTYDAVNLNGRYTIAANALADWNNNGSLETVSIYYILQDVGRTVFDLGITGDSRYTTVENQLSMSYDHRAMTPIESKLTADQKVLDWAIYTIENPPAGFDWDTNDLVVGSNPFTLPPELPDRLGISYPGSTFLLQNASPAALYPTFVGSLVYDTFLQKWGKMKADFKALLDYSPLNSSNDGSIPYSNFGLDAGILTAAGYVYLFSSPCTDSRIRYGKFAMSRQGFTSLETIDIKFRKPFTGSITLSASLDGRSLHSSLDQTESFTDVGRVTLTPDYDGRWFVITIIGDYDLRSMDFTGRPAGIR